MVERSAPPLSMHVGGWVKVCRCVCMCVCNILAYYYVQHLFLIMFVCNTEVQ